MSKQELSRRKVLAGLGTAGGASAFLGSGASALLTDEETFSNNAISASTSVAGEIDLDVQPNPMSVSVDFGNFANNGTITIPAWDVTLPDIPQNNPAYVWLRLKDCPDPPSCADDLEVELKLDCESGDITLVDGVLSNVVDTLRDGVPIDPDCGSEAPGGQSCFETGQSIRVILNWTATESFQGCSLQLPFEFHATQCRYNDGAMNPFPDLPECDETSGKSISFIAFCRKDGTSFSVDMVSAMNDLKSVEWQTSQGIDYLVLFGGGRWTIYDYSNDSTSDGPATLGDTNAAFDGTLASPESYCQGNAQSCPWKVAEHEVGGGTIGKTDFTGTSIKYEYCDDEFKKEGDC
jgi:hypothetical protein